MNNNEEQRKFHLRIYDKFLRFLNFIRSLQRIEKIAIVLVPSSFFLVLSVLFIVLIENVWKKGLANSWVGLAWFTGIVCLITITVWIIISDLKRSVKLLFLTIPAVIIMLIGIIFSILGFLLVWYLDLGSVALLLTAIASGFVHIITADMWRRARKKEKKVRN